MTAYPIHGGGLNTRLPVLPRVRVASLSPTERIIRATAQATGTRVRELRGPSRTRPLVTARHVAMTLCREMTGRSLPAIGAAFRRDHTTVLSAIRAVDGRPGAAVIFDAVRALLDTDVAPREPAE